MHGEFAEEGEADRQTRGIRERNSSLAKGDVARRHVLARSPAKEKSLSENSFILGVCADPEPRKSVCFQSCQGAEVPAHSHGPVFADFLEMQRWMARIVPPQPEILVRQSLNLRRQLSEGLTEAWFDGGIHPAESPPGPCSRFRDARRANQAGQISRPSRSSDRSPFRADGRSTRPASRILPGSIPQSPLRFPLSSSRIHSIHAVPKLQERSRGFQTTKYTLHTKK